MNVSVIKALCRRIEDRYGSNRNAAIAAGVQPSVWSCYCSDDHPTGTIPFHRLMMVANVEERRAFADLLLGEDADPPPGDMLCEAAEAVEEGAELLHVVRMSSTGGKSPTPRQRREIVDRALHLKADVEDVIRLAELPPQRVRRAP